MKVWLTTSVVAPFLSYIIDKLFSFGLVSHYSVVGTDGFFFFSIIFGLIFSIPALLLLCTTTYLLKKTNWCSTKIKYITALFAILFALLTIDYIYNKYIEIELIPLFISYPILTGTFTLLYSLQSPKHKS
jgi:Sec-independent protein secretion pathway component TatC